MYFLCCWASTVYEAGIRSGYNVAGLYHVAIFSCAGVLVCVRRKDSRKRVLRGGEELSLISWPEGLEVISDVEGIGDSCLQSWTCMNIEEGSASSAGVIN